MKQYSFIVFFLFLTSVLLGQYGFWQDDPDLDRIHWGMEFHDLSTNKTVVGYQAQKLFNPASTIKLISSLMFLEEKGEDYQFETKFGYTGVIRNGVLEGDLIIYGNGDPSLGSTRYGTNRSIDHLINKWYQDLQSAGINCVNGKLIVDVSAYGSDCTPNTWQYMDLGNYYASGCWSLNMNENTYQLDLKRSASKVSVEKLRPEIDGFEIDAQVKIGKKGSGDQAYIFCSPYQNYAVVRGSIPPGSGLFRIKGAIPNVPQFIAQSVHKSLSEKGIFINGIDVRYDKTKMSKTLSIVKSPTLKVLAKSALHKSINLYCESFLKSYGSGDRDIGIEKIIDGLINRKIIDDTKAIKIADGSGLSQRNYVSPSMMVKLLSYFSKKMELKNLLAQNGKEGTLKNTFVTKQLKGKIFGKSGSMGGVRAYAGILITKSKKEFAFSIMMNNYTFSNKSIKLKIQRILEEVYRRY